jgi:hypothetical protein
MRMFIKSSTILSICYTVFLGVSAVSSGNAISLHNTTHTLNFVGNKHKHVLSLPARPTRAISAKDNMQNIYNGLTRDRIIPKSAELAMSNMNMRSGATVTLRDIANTDLSDLNAIIGSPDWRQKFRAVVNEFPTYEAKISISRMGHGDDWNQFPILDTNTFDDSDSNPDVTADGSDSNPDVTADDSDNTNDIDLWPNIGLWPTLDNLHKTLTATDTPDNLSDPSPVDDDDEIGIIYAWHLFL